MKVNDGKKKVAALKDTTKKLKSVAESISAIENAANTMQIIEENRKYLLPVRNQTFTEDFIITNVDYLDEHGDAKTLKEKKEYYEHMRQFKKSWYDTGDAVISYNRACNILAKIFGRNAVEICCLPSNTADYEFEKYIYLDDNGNEIKHFWQAAEYAIRRSGDNYYEVPSGSKGHVKFQCEHSDD